MNGFAEASHVLDKLEVPYSFYKSIIFSLIYMTISDGCQFVLVPNELVLCFIPPLLFLLISSAICLMLYKKHLKYERQPTRNFRNLFISPRFPSKCDSLIELTRKSRNKPKYREELSICQKWHLNPWGRDSWITSVRTTRKITVKLILQLISDPNQIPDRIEL